MVLLVAGLLIAFLAFNLISQRFFAILTTDAHSLALRQKLIASSWAMFWQSPFLGVGPGRFLLELPSFFQVQEVIRFFQPVHNIYLLVANEWGVWMGLMLAIGGIHLLRHHLKKTS